MNTYHLKQKWDQGILGYPTAEEIDFLFAEVERLGKRTTPLDFEHWLRSVCFQNPTKEAYDLAKLAWENSNSLEVERLEGELAAAEIKIRELKEK